MILTLEHYTKSYGEKKLFDDVNLAIDEGDKIGIVGVNGTGKSTFLSAVAGRTPVDGGARVEMRGLRIEVLAQDKSFAPENTVLMEVFRGTSPLMQALREYELALKAVEDAPDDARVQRFFKRQKPRAFALVEPCHRNARPVRHHGGDVLRRHAHSGLFRLARLFFPLS